MMMFMQNKFNWVGIAGGVATLLLIAVSWFVPWWQFTVGNPAIVEANFSPVNLNFALFGNSVVIPLVLALNIAVLLSLASGGIIMLIYSFIPARPYSKRLLSFGYNKPLYAVLFFVIELVSMVVLTESIGGFNVPLMGSATIQIPQFLTQGATVKVSVLATLEWPFWFAIAVSVICVAARLYHRKVGKVAETATQP